jgi:hypothetical protein
MPYVFKHTSKGPVIEVNSEEIIFIDQFGIMVELADEYQDFLPTLKTFIADKLRVFLEEEIDAMSSLMGGVRPFAEYLNSMAKIKEFELVFLPAVRQQENQS